MIRQRLLYVIFRDGERRVGIVSSVIFDAYWFAWLRIPSRVFALTVDHFTQLQRIDVLRDVVPALLVERAQNFRHDFRGAHLDACSHAQTGRKTWAHGQAGVLRAGVDRAEGGLKLSKGARGD